MENQLINISYWVFLLEKTQCIFPINGILPWKEKEMKQ